jgi:hypothetical protein
MKELLNQLPHLTIDQLTQLIEEAKKQIELKNKPVLQLQLKENIWYAVGGGHTFKLGPVGTTSQILADRKERKPSPSQFALTPSQAQALKAQNPELVGWVDTDGARAQRTYYNMPEYDKAVRAWHKRQILANDDRMLLLRLSLEAVYHLHKLEAQGYRVLLPE